jgi:hypothetical protein
MKTMRLIFSRYRLLTGILALAVSLCALMTAPPSVRASIDCEDMGCVDWSSNWCFSERFCCVDSDTGAYACKDVYHEYPYFE